MVRRVFSFVYREVRGLHQAAYVLALFAFGSQILAIVRDRLLASAFGADSELDVYYAAFRIPDLLYVGFASVLSVYVLLPFVVAAQERAKSDSSVTILSQVFTLFLIGYSVLAAMVMVGAPVIMPWLFPGLAGESSTLVSLTQILLLQPLLLGVSSLCAVITQSTKRFIIYAISPLLYNVGIIVGIMVFYPWFGLLGLGGGGVRGAVLHLLLQVPSVSRGTVPLRLTQVFVWSDIRDVLRSAIPRAVTLSLTQILLLLFTTVASTMVVGSVAVLQLGYNLQSVPLVIIGMSYSVAAFPTLTTLYAKRDIIAFNAQLTTALRHIIFWSIPVIALVVVLRAQLVRVLLGSGEFDWSDTRLTAAVLALFVVSLVAQAITMLLVRGMYAAGNTRVPLILTLLGAGMVLVALAGLQYVQVAHPGAWQSLESLLRISGVPGAEVIMLPLAYSLGMLFQLGLFLVAMIRMFGLVVAPLGRLFIQAMLAGFMGGLCAYLALLFVVDGVNQETFIGIALQGLVGGVCGLIGVVVTYRLLHAPELFEISAAYHSRLFKRDVIPPQTDAP